MRDQNYPEGQPALLPWLRRAAITIEVSPPDPQSVGHQWWKVLVGNGQGGHAGAASIVARCHDKQHADLVAAGLRALLAQDPVTTEALRLEAEMGKLQTLNIGLPIRVEFESQECEFVPVEIQRDAGGVFVRLMDAKTFEGQTRP